MGGFASAFSTFLQFTFRYRLAHDRRDIIWQLKTFDRGEPWTEVGNFDSVAEAARRIIERQTDRALLCREAATQLERRPPYADVFLRATEPGR